MPNQPITLSAVITNFQGKDLVQKCVAALLADTYPIEIIVADNGSTDGSIPALEQQFRDRVRVLALQKNRGPAAAWNQGVAAAQGEVLLLLDNDTEVQPGTLQAIAETFAGDATIGAAQCKLVFKADPTRIDCVGHFISSWGVLIDRAPVNSIDTGQYDTPEEIFAAKSAAMAVRHSAFRKAGGFDERYFQYVIETDLCWRIWRSGYRIIFCPGTKVWHVWGGTEKVWSDQYKRMNVKYQGARNVLLTLIKNLEWWRLFVTVPRNIMIWLGMAAWSLLYKDGAGARGILTGIWWIFSHIPETLRARHTAQQIQQVSNRLIFSRVMRRQSLLYFVKKIYTPFTLKKESIID